MTTTKTQEEKEIIPRTKIIFWLHRVLAEKTLDLVKISKRIGDLNHQVANFDKMAEKYQEEVIQALEEDFQKYKWNVTIEVKP